MSMEYTEDECCTTCGRIIGYKHDLDCSQLKNSNGYGENIVTAIDCYRDNPVKPKRTSWPCHEMFEIETSSRAFERAPGVWKLRNLMSYVTEANVSVKITDDQWVPTRPGGFDSIHNRIKAAWLVFTGKADAVIWPGQ